MLLRSHGRRRPAGRVGKDHALPGTDEGDTEACRARQAGDDSVSHVEQLVLAIQAGPKRCGTAPGDVGPRERAQHRENSGERMRMCECSVRAAQYACLEARRPCACVAARRARKLGEAQPCSRFRCVGEAIRGASSQAASKLRHHAGQAVTAAALHAARAPEPRAWEAMQIAHSCAVRGALWR